LCKSRDNWRESYPVNVHTDSAAILFRGLCAAEEVPDSLATLEAEVAHLRAQPTIAAFIAEVNRRAEQTIERTGQVSGAHWNAMRAVAKEWGIDADAPEERK